MRFEALSPLDKETYVIAYTQIETVQQSRQEGYLQNARIWSWRLLNLRWMVLEPVLLVPVCTYSSPKLSEQLCSCLSRLIHGISAWYSAFEWSRSQFACSFPSTQEDASFLSQKKAGAGVQPWRPAYPHKSELHGRYLTTLPTKVAWEYIVIVTTGRTKEYYKHLVEKS